MDRSWINLNHRSHPEYIRGVKEFLNFALSNLANETLIRCPCSRCNNRVQRSPKQVQDHLFIHGMLKNYNKWVHHGEYDEVNINAENCEDDGGDVNIEVDDDVDTTNDMLHDMWNSTHGNKLGNGTC